MAAHAVGDGEYGWGHGQAVFIMVANQADVGTRTVFGKIDLGVAGRGAGPSLRRPLFVPHSHGDVADIDHIAALERDRFSDALAVYGSAVVEPKSSTNRFWPMMEKRAWRAET